SGLCADQVVADPGAGYAARRVGRARRHDPGPADDNGGPQRVPRRVHRTTASTVDGPLTADASGGGGGGGGERSPAGAGGARRGTLLANSANEGAPAGASLAPGTSV